MVQGGDWQQTADRTKIVDYARRHGIRIVVLPYSKNISSTAIKERAFNSLSEARREKQLQFDLATQLSLPAVDHLYTYEASDPERTARVAERISSIGALLDPLTVADIGRGRSLVIDGTNRLEALRLLGARCAPVQRVRYLDHNSVKLRGNEHYIDAHPAQVLALVARAGVPLRIHQPTAGLQRFGADTLALIYADGAVHALPSTRNWVSNVERLNALVRSYKGQIPFRRKSEIGNLIGEAGVLVKFRAFTPSDLVVLISKRMVLESGITWHIPETTVVRFRVPLMKLKEGFDSRRDADRYIRGLVDARQRRHSIRRYLSSVYICDEWEPSEC